MTVEITFFGAAREVTGSMHLISAGQDRVLLDCGMFQGRRKECEEKNRHLAVDPSTITNVILSHAHIDHSGRLPLLVKKGFAGRVLSTRATADACRYLLPDAAHIQESDATYLNYKTVRARLRQEADQKSGGRKKKSRREIRKMLKSNGHRLDVAKIGAQMERLGITGVTPLYTFADAERTLGHFDPYPYRQPVTVGKGMTCRLYEAGHILGSALTVVRVEEGGKATTIGYTGDIGRFQKPILRDPALAFEEPDRRLDLLVMESTYGDRVHPPVEDLGPSLREVLQEAYERGGCVIIPSFAFGRTQELLYVLHELYDAGEVPRMPIYVDSPLATRITTVFGEHPEVYDREAHEAFLQKGKNPFCFDKLHFVRSVEESMALNRDERPHIVVSASGMCEAGRVLHHLRHKIHNPLHTILIVGFMARHTLGRRILELGSDWEKGGRKGDPPIVRILNKEYPLRAHVRKIGGFSAHADRDEMLRFLKDANFSIGRIAVVHGEEDQATAFAGHLEKAGYTATVPHPGETVSLG